MRRVFAVLLLLLGVPLLIAGAAAAVLVGPRDTVSTGTHRISTPGSAIVTSGSLLRYVGPTLHVTARTASGHGDVFIGVGHHADVQSYLAGSSYSTVTGFRPPWKVIQDESTVGGFTPVPRPAGLPFWVASAHGPGQQELNWPTTDGDWNVVLTTTTPSTGGLSFDVSVGLTVRYLFEALIAVAVAGLILCVLAVMLLRRKRRRAEPAGPPPAGSRPAPAAADAKPVPAAAGARTVPAAGGEAVPAAGGEAVPAAGGEAVPAAGGEAASAAGGRPVPAAAGAGQPPWGPAPPPPAAASPARTADTGPLGRAAAEPGDRSPGELFRPAAATRTGGPAEPAPSTAPAPAQPPPGAASPEAGPSAAAPATPQPPALQPPPPAQAAAPAGPGAPAEPGARDDLPVLAEPAVAYLARKWRPGPRGDAGTEAALDAATGAAEAGFRTGSGWPGRSAPLDPGEPDPGEDPEAADTPEPWAGAVSGGRPEPQASNGPQWVPGSGPPQAAWNWRAGPGGAAAGRPRRPPEAAHGDEWAPPPPKPAKPARQRPAQRPKRTAPED